MKVEWICPNPEYPSVADYERLFINGEVRGYVSRSVTLDGDVFHWGVEGKRYGASSSRASAKEAAVNAALEA